MVAGWRAKERGEGTKTMSRFLFCVWLIFWPIAALSFAVGFNWFVWFGVLIVSSMVLFHNLWCYETFDYDSKCGHCGLLTDPDGKAIEKSGQPEPRLVP